MAAPDFKYEEFAQTLAAQAVDLVPPEFNEDQKQYVVNTLGNFSMMAGKALAEDPNLNFDADQSSYITQIIAEWSFHKSVDVIRSGIPRQYWDSIMQKIAYTIFEIAKQAFSQGMGNDQIIEIIEHHVTKTYVDAVTELKDKGIIDEELMEFAASQSNMNKMAQEMQAQAQAQQMQPQEQVDGMPAGVDQNMPPTAAVQAQMNPQSPAQLPKVDSKVMKLATVAMLFKRMNQDKVQSILNKFEDEDARAVIQYMQLPDLAQKIGPQNALRCLQEIKTTIPKNTDLTPVRVVNTIKNFMSRIAPDDMERVLIKERIGVKRLVFNAAEDKYYDKVPPKIASIIATHLQSIV